MATEITVPRLGWSMEEGTFVGWLAAEGKFVASGELLFALESDKATQEIESIDSGILRLISKSPQAGQSVTVGQLLGYLLEPGEEPPALSVMPDPSKSAPPDSPATSEFAPLAQESPLKPSPPITPRARRTANLLGIDPARIEGSGRGGRVRERDVLSAGTASGEEPLLTPLRRRIAERMTRSLRETAPVTLTCRVDASELVSYRKRWQAKEGLAPSYTDILAKFTARALRQHPRLAARWEGERIILAKSLNIGIAVDTEEGLLVPVIRDVCALSIAEIASQSRGLVQAARAGRLKPEDMQGGIFTLTNLGSFGIDAFTPIINYPEAAVLGIGQIQPEFAVLSDGQFGLRQKMSLSLTFDHRIVDGAPAARFLQCLRGLIEQCLLPEDQP